jgi:cytochrome P450 family 307 subfamily A
MQKTRRDMLSSHTFPRKFGTSFDRLNDITMDNYQQLSYKIRAHIDNENEMTTTGLAVKPIVMSLCANIFTEYFTTRTFSHDDEKFQDLVKNFDKIFWEVNQGYAADFLPFLLPFHTKRMKRMQHWSHEIRHYILNHIISDRFASWTVGSEPNDYVESLIDHVKQNSQPEMDWDTVSS